ncbi:BnaC04g15160D [Brassica napus]|uniref:BnaC04g15160D protein n=1 Tax=Brassica napus TaxID=3708 RepID=A0A078HNV6_BRANA|nr:BnaC04g15160D [Brassica napus]
MSSQRKINLDKVDLDLSTRGFYRADKR